MSEVDLKTTVDNLIRKKKAELSTTQSILQNAHAEITDNASLLDFVVKWTTGGIEFEEKQTATLSNQTDQISQELYALNKLKSDLKQLDNFVGSGEEQKAVQLKNALIAKIPEVLNVIAESERIRSTELKQLSLDRDRVIDTAKTIETGLEITAKVAATTVTVGTALATGGASGILLGTGIGTTMRTAQGVADDLSSNSSDITPYGTLQSAAKHAPQAFKQSTIEAASAVSSLAIVKNIPTIAASGATIRGLLVGGAFSGTSSVLHTADNIYKGTENRTADKIAIDTVRDTGMGFLLGAVAGKTAQVAEPLLQGGAAPKAIGTALVGTVPTLAAAGLSLTETKLRGQPMSNEQLAELVATSLATYYVGRKATAIELSSPETVSWSPPKRAGETITNTSPDLLPPNRQEANPNRASTHPLPSPSPALVAIPDAAKLSSNSKGQITVRMEPEASETAKSKYQATPFQQPQAQDLRSQTNGNLPTAPSYNSLSDAQLAKIDEFSNDFLNNAFTYGLDSTESQRTLIKYMPFGGNDLATIVSNSASIPYYTSRPSALSRAASGRFMDNLLSFIERKSNDRADSDRALSFAMDLTERYFESSRTITDDMPLLKALEYTARANRLPIIQRSFGTDLTTSLLDRINSMSSSQALKEWVSSQPAFTTLAILDELSQINAHALSAGVYKTAIDHIASIYSYLGEHSSFPLVRYSSRRYFSLALGHATKPPISIFQWKGDPQNARLNLNLSESEVKESNEIMGSVNIKGPHSNLPLAQILSKDHYGLYDQAGNLQAVFPRSAASDHNQSVKSNPIKTENLRVYLAKTPTLTKRTALSVTQYAHQHLGDVKLSGQSQNTYQSLLRIGEELQQIQQQLDLSICSFCEEVSEAFCSSVQQTLEREVNSGNSNTTVIRTLQNIRQANDRQDRFRIAESFISLNRQFGPIVSADANTLLNQKSSAVRSLHSWAWAQMQGAQQPYPELRESLASIPEMFQKAKSLADYAHDTYQKIDSLDAELNQIQEPNNQNFLQFRTDMLSYIDQLQLAQSALPDVEPRPIQEIVDDRALFPFENQSGSNNSAFQIQTLNSLSLRRFIEGDLGIDLSTLTLRSQNHFLSFLSTQNRVGFDRLKRDLASHRDSANLILEAFLAHAEDPSYAENILTIAEKLSPAEAKVVFERYNHIAQDTERLAQSIATEPHFSSLTEDQLQTLSTTLLRNANRIMDNVVKELAAGHESTEQILERVELAHQDSLITGGVLKLLGPSIPLVEVQGVAIDIQSARDLSATDKGIFERIAANNIYTAWYYERATKDTYFHALQEALNDPSPDQKFYTLRINGNLTNFLRIVPTEDPDTLYIASFNSTGLRGTGLGRPFLQSIVSMFGNNYNLTLSYDPHNPAASLYRDLGFVEQERHSIAGSSREQILARRPKKAEPTP